MFKIVIVCIVYTCTNVGYHHFNEVCFSTLSSFWDSYMHCLSMFIVVLQELHYLQQCLLLLLWCVHVFMCVSSFIVIGYCVSELHGHYCNVLPEAIYCCFTRTTLFTKFFTCLYNQSLRLLSYHQALLLYTFWFLRYNVAKCIARGCLLLF